MCPSQLHVLLHIATVTQIWAEFPFLKQAGKDIVGWAKKCFKGLTRTNFYSFLQNQLSRISLGDVCCHLLLDLQCASR